jgi:hypothetical protein
MKVKLSLEEDINRRYLNLKAKASRNEHGCLLWNGFLNAGGYAQIEFRNKTYYVHAFSYMNAHKLTNISNGLQIRHGKNCATNCFEPSHLTIGTAKDQAQDKRDHGTMYRGEKCKKTKLTGALALKIFQLKGVDSTKEKASRYGVSSSTIRAIESGKSWTHVTGLIPQTKNYPSTNEVITHIVENESTRIRILTRLQENSITDEVGCILWQGTTGEDGYAIIQVLGINIRGHRAAWACHNKRIIPEGMEVRHSALCVNKPTCVNHEHLSIGTHKQNMDDMNRDGTRLRGEKAGGATHTELQIIKVILSKGIGTQERRSQVLGVSRGTIEAVDNCIRWKHLSRDISVYPPLNSDTIKQLTTPIPTNMHQITTKRIGLNNLKGEDAGGSKHTQAEIIKVILSKGMGSQKHRSRILGVTKSTIESVDSGKRWTHLSRDTNDYPPLSQELITKLNNSSS